MANRNYSSLGKIYSAHVQPVLIDGNFIVDSTNGNLLGQRSLKGPGIHQVYMQSVSGGPYVPPAGSPNLATSASFVALGASAITNTGSSVLTGNVGLYAGTSFTGFPPGIVIGVEHITDAAANQAQIDATAAYNDLSTRAATVIPSALDGQTLTAGVYKFASGSASLAASGNGTLTLSGSATDIFVIQTASTLTTGAGGTPTILLTGGALATNVYWAIGSSATLNVSGTGTFIGTLIAHTSVTIDGGAVIGRLFANTGALSFSAATAAGLPPTPGGSTHVLGTPLPGIIVVQLHDNFNRSITGIKAVVSPVSGIPLQIDASALTQGMAYVIVNVGNATNAQFNALGLPAGVVPSVGASFIASSVGAGPGTSTARVEAVVTSNITTIETVGDPNQSIAPDPTKNQGFGAQFILQTRNSSGVIAAPVDGTVISLGFLLNNSGVTVQGE
jgi:type VI secretion system secreted protein VgrG